MVLPEKSSSTLAVRSLVIVVLPIGVAFCFTSIVRLVAVLALPEK